MFMNSCASPYLVLDAVFRCHERQISFNGEKNPAPLRGARTRHARRGPLQGAGLGGYDRRFCACEEIMRRRDSIMAMSAAAGYLSAPLAVRAQQTKTRTIGWLS